MEIEQVTFRFENATPQLTEPLSPLQKYDELRGYTLTQCALRETSSNGFPLNRNEKRSLHIY